jgi:hypothetical protein
MEKINPQESKVLSEVNSEAPTESNPPLSEVKNENQKNLIKTDLCQLIYYDFSLK